MKTIMAALLAATASTSVTDSIDSLTLWIEGKSDGTMDLTTLECDLIDVPETTTETALKASL